MLLNSIHTLIIAAEQAPGGGMMSMFMMIGLLFVVMYFFMIRPQSKKQKAMDRMRNELSRNDKIITQGGLIGVVSKIKDNEIVLKVDENNNTRVTIVKTAVLHILEHSGSSEEKEKDDEDKD